MWSRTDYKWIGRTTSKKSDWKNEKMRKLMSKCRMWTKTKSNELKLGSNKKLGLKWTMNGLGKPFRKKYKKSIEQ